jgi:hypothetical protein
MCGSNTVLVDVLIDGPTDRDVVVPRVIAIQVM